MMAAGSLVARSGARALTTISTGSAGWRLLTAQRPAASCARSFHTSSVSLDLAARLSTAEAHLDAAERYVFSNRLTQAESELRQFDTARDAATAVGGMTTITNSTALDAPALPVISALMLRMCRARDFEGAMCMNELLRKFQLDPDARFWSELLVAASVQRDTELLVLAAEALIEHRAQLDQGTLLNALHCAARAVDTAAGERVWRLLELSCGDGGGSAQSADNLPPRPDAEAFLSLIALRAAAGELPAAFAALFRMSEVHGDLEVAVRSLSALVAACSRSAKAMDEAFYLLQDRHDAGLAIPTAAANVVIAGAARGGDMDRARQTYADLTGKLEVRPNSDTFSELLWGCSINAEWAAFAPIVAEMEALGVRADAQAHAAMVEHDSLHLRSVEAVLQRVEAMSSDTSVSTPSTQVYRRAVLMALVKEDLTSAKKATVRMQAAMRAAGYPSNRVEPQFRDLLKPNLANRMADINVKIPEDYDDFESEPAATPALV